MLASLMNGGTLYLRGSDWNATLTQVGAKTLLSLANVKLTSSAD
jgi:hypothetical protein